MARADVQTSLRMPEELRARLTAEAAKNGYGVGIEICRRLEASFGSVAVPVVEDQKTGDLLRVVARCATILAEQWAPWHADAGSFTVFSAAIADVLSRHKPESAGAEPKTDRAASLFRGKPEDAGSLLAFSAEMVEGLL